MDIRCLCVACEWNECDDADMDTYGGVHVVCFDVNMRRRQHHRRFSASQGDFPYVFQESSYTMHINVRTQTRIRTSVRV